ncbi:MAG: hypothetical protein ACKOXB_02275 [Flavobacteriales bacterium]
MIEAQSSDDGIIWERQAKYDYFLHGPLARTEIGEDQVQGLDYTYTKHGWLAGMNSTNLKDGYDLGGDGLRNGNSNGVFARDAAGFSLGYYEGAYTPIGWTNDVNQFKGEEIHGLFDNGSPAGKLGLDLFNGNISHMVTAIYLDSLSRQGSKHVDNVGAFLNRRVRELCPQSKGIFHIRSSVLTHWAIENRTNISKVMYQAGYKCMSSAEVYMDADTNTLSEKVQKFFAVKLN